MLCDYPQLSRTSRASRLSYRTLIVAAKCVSGLNGFRGKGALALLEVGQTPRRPGRWDDRQVRGCYKFLRILRDADPAAVAEVEGRGGRRIDAAALEKYFTMRAGIWYAFRIFGNEDRAWRWLVEAAILTGEDDAQIAKQFHTLPDAIHWYEALYFNVRDRLDSKHWVLKTIRGPWALNRPHPDGSPTGYQQGVDLKLCAYFSSLPSAASDAEGAHEPSDLERAIDAMLREIPPELLQQNQNPMSSQKPRD